MRHLDFMQRRRRQCRAQTETGTRALPRYTSTTIVFQYLYRIQLGSCSGHYQSDLNYTTKRDRFTVQRRPWNFVIDKLSLSKYFREYGAPIHSMGLLKLLRPLFISFSFKITNIYIFQHKQIICKDHLIKINFSLNQNEASIQGQYRIFQ